MSENSSPNVTFDSLNSMKVVDLRQELDKRGLDKSGLKADLVKRLERSMLDESSMTDTEMEDNNEERRVGLETSQVSELEDVQMESADSNDLIKSEDVDEAFSEPQLLDTNKFSEEENDDENGSQEKEVKEKLTSILDTIEATGSLFHRVDDIELEMEEENGPFITAELKEAKNIEENCDKKTLNNLNFEKEPELMNVPDTIFDKLDDNNSVEKIAFDELKTTEQNNPGEILDLPVNQESHSDKVIFVNKEKLDKTSDGIDNKSLTGDESDKISSKSSDQVSKQNSNTEIVNTSSKEPSEISDSSENKKDSLLKSDNTVKRNEDKKTDLSKCIWISGLSSVTKAVDLKDVCSKVGKVLGAKVVTSAKTPGSQCFGFVTMSSSDEAKKCIEALHKSTLHEKVIQVEKAKTDPTPPKKQTEKKSERQEDRSQSSRQSKSSRTSSTSRATRRDDRGSRRDERRPREAPKDKESKKEVITIEDNDKNVAVISTPKNLSPVSKRSANETSKNQEKIKNDTDTETKTVEDGDKKEAKSVEQLRKERAEKIEHEHKLREERRRKERERERQLREEQRKEQDKREKERRERARKEAERVRKEREKQRELEKQREKERERERERFLLERKEREERERRDRERERELLERERLEREKLERERKERERLEIERIERERQEQERLEKERLARIERDNRIEKERQRLEQERLDRERRDRDRSRIIDRGIDRNIGNGSSLKRSAYDDRVIYYADSKRSLREDSPLSNRKDFFSSSENPDSYLKDDDYDLLNQRRSLLPPGNNRSKSDHRNERRNNEDRRDLRNDRQPREEDLYRDRPVFNVQPDVRRVVQRADSRPFNRDRSPIRVDERNTLRDLDRRDWLDVQSNAPKTLSDVLGRAGLTGILGNQAEIKSFDIRPLNQQMEEEQYYIRSSNRVDDRTYRSEVRDSREDVRVMHGLERLHKERVELSDNRIENKGLQRYDERRSDARKDLERRDIRSSPPLRTRNEERVFRNSDPPHMLNNHDLKGALQDSITDRRGLHPAAAELGNRGLAVVPPRILPISDLFGRPMQQVPAGSTAAQALQAGYVAAAHGLALHQAAQNIQLRDGRLEYTQQVRQPVPNLRRY